jgi:tetratricopeptide (TPR) repeat protein
MSALVCDICGGKLKVINGKMAVCESCGMEHSLERVREKYRESQKVVHVDNAHLISNYYAMAQDAYDAGNKEEAERYCNKIIEIDSTDTDALFLKGKAVGWQSSIGAFRFKEAAICFANALGSCTTESEKTSLHDRVQDEFRGLATALIQLRCDRFQKWPDGDESKGFKNDLDELSEAVSLYAEQTNLKIDQNFVFSNVASIVRLCMTIVSMTILLEYRVNGSKRAYSEFADKTDNCIAIMQKTIDLCDDDDDSDAQLYEQCIEMAETLIKFNANDMIRDHWGAYKETPRMSSSEVSRRQRKIEEYKSRIQKLKK